MKELFSLNKYFARYRWHFIGGILFVAVSNLFAVLSPQIIRYAIDFVQDNLAVNAVFKTPAFAYFYESDLAQALMIFTVLIISLSLLKGFFMYLNRQTIIVMSRRIEYDLKNSVFDKYQQLSMSFYKRNNTGDMMNRISEDVSRARMYVGPAIMYTLNLIVLFIMVITTMFNVNPVMTFYVLTPLPFLAIIIYAVSQRINKKSEYVQRKLSDMSTFVQEAFSGIRVIKAYNRTKEREFRFTEECNEYKDSSLDLVKVEALFAPVMILLIGLSTTLTIFIGGQLTIDGQVSPGNIAEFVIYVNMLTWPVASLGWVTSLVQRAAASQKRINEFLDEPNEITNPTDQPFDLKGAIEFKNVSFTYPDSGVEALKDVSFTVNPGQSLAIIGHTGSGKSTIANLICRLFDVDSGSITVDKKPIESINLDQYRDSIGYVPQEVFLFSDKISANIAFSTSIANSNKEAIEQAAKDAVIYSNIIEFPEGFDTRVGERGITLSGGQKQRISIARAVIKNPHLLIFDDCLSAVDTETEEQILNNLKRLMDTRTTIIISHRVSSVKHADEIIVMDDGKIIERGTHDELMTLKGSYSETFEKQQLEQMRVGS